VSATPGEVSRLMYQAATETLRMLAAERDLPAPSAIRHVNQAQRDFLAACCQVADAYRSLTEVPREWRLPERKSA
jgi:hypothetical protein